MPKAPSPERAEAKSMYLASDGKKMLRIIAEELSVSEGTVRGWKAKDHWDDELSGAFRKKKRSVPKKPKKRGAPKGNKNAKGNRGGPGTPPKHGGYTAVYWDTLDEDEKILIEEESIDAEKYLERQIQLYSIRERRLMKAIEKYRKSDMSLSVQSVHRGEEKREFPNTEQGKLERQRYEELRIQKQNEDLISYFGKTVSVNTITESNIAVIGRLEAELTKVQRAKNQAIDSLARYRLEQKRLQMEQDNIEIEDTSETDGAIYGETRL